MLLARVLGPVVATIKHPAFHAHKLLLVQPLDAGGRAQGAEIIAVDTVQAGKGDLVLVMREGTGARQITGQKNAPIRSLIAGIVDRVDVSGQPVLHGASHGGDAA
jgi:ethanolamine utilization protein EutN